MKCENIFFLPFNYYPSKHGTYLVPQKKRFCGICCMLLLLFLLLEQSTLPSSLVVSVLSNPVEVLGDLARLGVDGVCRARAH